MNTIVRRLRLDSPWWVYAAALVPLGILYAAALVTTGTLPLSLAIRQAIVFVAPISLIGVGVWWLSGKLAGRFHPAGIVAAHLVVALVVTAAWLAFEVGMIAAEANLTLALQVARGFAGFQVIDGLFVYAVLSTGSHVIRVSARLREEEARTARADALRVRAELAALRGQLNPHFLFNTLHTLTALVRLDPATAERALEQFGDMLRYVLDVKRAAREDVALAEELRFVRDYLALEQLRLGDRLRVVERVDPDALDCLVPSLTLQPIVENAIKHAIAPRIHGGTIEIVASLDDDTLLLEVGDDGPGAATDDVETAGGMGLRTVRRRLETRYGASAAFRITTAPRAGFRVHIAVPAAARSLALDAAGSAAAAGA